MMNNIGNKICAGAMKRIKETGIRSDMALADFNMIDKATANVLIAYANEVPTNQEIAKFVTATFAGKAYPVMETTRAYELQKCVAVTVQAPQLTRAFEDSGKMQAITACTFVDVNDGAEWEVKTNASTGAKFLARAMDEDFESIIAAHKTARGSSPLVTASSNFQSVTASYLTANDEDFVKFFDGNGLQCGTIKQVMPDGSVKILNDEGELFVVPKTSITQIIRKDPEEQKQITDDMEAFYSKIWGEQFSRELFKDGSQV